MLPLQSFRVNLGLLLAAAAVSYISSGALAACPFKAQPHHRMADGCRHVYIDMGTNIGHQIRKLYEPHMYYKGNPTERIFNKYFGLKRDKVCAFGFEGNPVHEPRLKRLETALRSLGYPARIFTSTAVSTKTGNVTFYTTPTNNEHNQWTASLKHDPISVPVTVRAMSMTCFMRQEVLGRRIPQPAHANESLLPPTIVMKSDIEGTDVQVLSHMLVKGALCNVSAIYGEHFTPEWLKAFKFLQNASGDCKTEILPDDDESGNDCLPMPGSTTPEQGAHCKDDRRRHRRLLQGMGFERWKLLLRGGKVGQVV